MMDVMDGADRPLVSIIVPVYRAERFLDVCVASLAGQTYRELDIILVDDSSPDSCPALCDAWAARDGRIRVAHTSGGGASAARNVGLGMAQGNAMMFVDSDDILDAQAVERALAAMQATGSAVVIFGKRYIDENGTVQRTSAIDHDMTCDGAAYDENLAYLLDHDYLSPPWGKLFSRSVIDGLRFDETMVYEEDLDFNLRALATRPRVCAMAEAMYRYRHMDSGMATVYSAAKVANVIAANRSKLRFFDGRLGKEGLKSLDHHIANDVGWIIPQIAEAHDVPISQRIKDIMSMTLEPAYRRHLVRGLPHAGLTRRLKMLMLVNARWLWRIYMRGWEE